MTPKYMDEPWTVYYLAHRGEPFYVGRTMRSLETRLYRHLKDARLGTRGLPFAYIRVMVNDLSHLEIRPWVTDLSYDESKIFERDCVKLLIASGAKLFQISHTPAESLQRYIDSNPTKSVESQRAANNRPDVIARKKEAARKRVETVEARQKISAGVSRYLSTPEGKLKSAAGGSKGSHTRWHVSRGITNPKCKWCTS